jgi:4-hydroxy-3-methylbut-2-enyl diphosphate reductase
MELLLANPRGFCAGVERAIGIVERALELYGSPIYVRHEVVHNKFVVEDLRRKGAVFVEALDEVPPGSTVIFSAHGVPRSVRAEAQARGLRVFDATCPLVTKVHVEVAKARRRARHRNDRPSRSPGSRGHHGPVGVRHAPGRDSRGRRQPFGA